MSTIHSVLNFSLYCVERTFRKRRRVSENQEIEDRLESLILRVGEKVSYSSIASSYNWVYGVRVHICVHVYISTKTDAYSQYSYGKNNGNRKVVNCWCPNSVDLHHYYWKYGMWLQGNVYNYFNAICFNTKTSITKYYVSITWNTHMVFCKINAFIIVLIPSGL